MIVIFFNTLFVWLLRIFLIPYVLNPVGLIVIFLCIVAVFVFFALAGEQHSATAETVEPGYNYLRNSRIIVFFSLLIVFNFFALTKITF